MCRKDLEVIGDDVKSVLWFGKINTIEQDRGSAKQRIQKTEKYEAFIIAEWNNFYYNLTVILICPARSSDLYEFCLFWFSEICAR